jgi:hypothetical protein
MGETPAAGWLMRDAERAIDTVLDYLKDLDIAG